MKFPVVLLLDGALLIKMNEPHYDLLFLRPLHFFGAFFKSVTNNCVLKMLHLRQETIFF